MDIRNIFGGILREQIPKRLQYMQMHFYYIKYDYNMYHQGIKYSHLA